MPDTALDQALREAYASAPADEIIYHTLEITHPDFTAPVRVVRGWDAITAGGSNWIAVPFDLTLPEASESGPPRLTITLDNVSRELMDGLDAASESGEKIAVTYRAFLSSNLATPMNDPPLALTLTAISVRATQIAATATLADFANRKFPRQVYTDNDYPGLIG